MGDNELLINAIVISRVIADELNGNQSYENILRVADDLKIEPFQVHEFLKLYKKAQQYMLL